jgi:hypothetical protein
VAPAVRTRDIGLLVWSALVVLPVAFLGVVLALGPPPRAPPALVTVFFWIAVAASLLDIVLARVLAPRIGGASSDPHAVAFARLLFALALSEAAAIFPLVAYLITGDARLLGVFAVDLLALVLLYPSDPRWDSLTPGAEAGAGRMVR